MAGDAVSRIGWPQSRAILWPKSTKEAFDIARKFYRFIRFHSIPRHIKYAETNNCIQISIFLLKIHHISLCYSWILRFDHAFSFTHTFIPDTKKCRSTHLAIGFYSKKNFTSVYALMLKVELSYCFAVISARIWFWKRDFRNACHRFLQWIGITWIRFQEYGDNFNFSVYWVHTITVLAPKKSNGSKHWTKWKPNALIHDR